MRLRPVLLGTLAVGLVAGGSALAAPKPVCNLIVDVEGDGKERLVGVYSSPVLDILSVDVATGKKDFVGVIRLKSTQTTSEPAAMVPPGVKWSLSFQINGINHSFSLTRTTTPTGVTDRATATIGGEAAAVTATVDGTSVTFKAARTVFAQLKKPKQSLASISAISYVAGGTADSAVGAPTLKYPDMTASCLRPA